jgi:hypothetical protein
VKGETTETMEKVAGLVEKIKAQRYPRFCASMVLPGEGASSSTLGHSLAAQFKDEVNMRTES